MTSYMALRSHLQKCLRMFSIGLYVQLQFHRHHWQRPLKKITTLEKRCILGIGIGNSTLQHLHIKSYKSYHHCEEIRIRRGGSLAKFTIECRTPFFYLPNQHILMC